MIVQFGKGSRAPAPDAAAASPTSVTLVSLAALTAFASSLAPGCAAISGQGPGAASLAPQSTVDIPLMNGLLWMPFSWTAQLSLSESDGAGKSLPVVQLRQLGVVVRETRTRKELVFKLSTPGADGLSNAVLDPGAPSRTFFLPLFQELPEGDYVVESVRGFYVDPNTQRPMPLTIALTNPFQPGGTPALGFGVRKGKVAAVGRLAARTFFGNKDGSVTTATDVESYDKDVVPVDAVLAQLRRPQSDASRVVAASPDFPRMRLALTDDDGAPQPYAEGAARAGLLVDVPCAAAGHLKLVWRRMGDDRDYFSLIPLGQNRGAQAEPKDDGSACKGQDAKTLAPSLVLPYGDWMLRSTQIVAPSGLPAAAKLEIFRSAEEFTRGYYMLSGGLRFTNSVSAEREIQRQLVARIDSMSKPGNGGGAPRGVRFEPGAASVRPRGGRILFLGHFALVPNETKAGTQATWDTLLKRNYSLATVKKAFDADEVYNAYTLARLERDRSKSTVQSVLRVSSAESDAKKVEPSSAEFRRGATEMFAQCLTEREEFDPLASVAGVAFFSVLKGNNSVTLKKLDLGGEGASERWIEDCFQKKLLAFRLSKRSPANFQGELKFASE